MAGEPFNQRLVNGETILLNTGLFSRWEKEAHCYVPGVSKDSCSDPHEDNEALNETFINRNAFSFTHSQKYMEDLPSAECTCN